jgi:hypothetical protein
MKEMLWRIALMAVLIGALGSTVNADGTIPPPSCPPGGGCSGPGGSQGS